MSVPTRIIKRGMFGKPTLQCLKNDGTDSGGLAEWVKEWTRYGEWTAKLTPGAQSGGKAYGAVGFAVNNMRLEDLKSVRYVYRMGSTEVIAPNVAIHVYDPNDIDNRADITLSHTHEDLGKENTKWYKFDLLPVTTGLFYYGDNIPTTTGLVAHGTAGNLYTLAQFQADFVFRNYVISKITIEYGYYSTGTIGAAHIAKISVNEEDILLEPSREEQLDTISEAIALIASLSLNVIEHHTASDTLTKEESGSTHTNLGAGAAITLTLPQDALAGCRFRFAVMADAKELRIDPGAAGGIYINGAQQTDDKYITADDIAESVELVADGNGDWVAIGAVGTWEVEG